MKLAICLSIIVHIIILNYEIPEPIQQPPKQIKVKLKYKNKIVKPKVTSKSIELYTINKIMSNIIRDLNKEKKEQDFVDKLLKKKKCTKHYNGIGISYDSFIYQRIIKVGINTPAEKAGLQIGDKLADLSPIRDMYPIGTVLTLPIIRNGIMLYINVTIGKICIN